MKHDDYKELLHLSFFDELGEEERRVLDDHSKGCDECRREIEELNTLDNLLNSSQRFVITDQLLDQARRELRVALRLEKSKRSVWAGLVERLGVLTSPPVRLAFAGAAMIVVGMMTGYFLFSSSEPMGLSSFMQTASQSSAQPATPKVTNFAFVGDRPQGSNVEFTFDLVTPVRMKGNVNDVAVQRILAQALVNDQNPGARLRAINAISERVDKERSSDVEVKAALVLAMKRDPNVGVRKQALQALRQFPMDNELKNALLFVLKNEENPGIRIDAIAYLQSPEFSQQVAGKDLLDVLKERMQTDNNNYVRTRAKHFYEEVQQQ